MVEGVEVHLTIEPLLQLVKAFAVLCQQPHAFGHYGLDGHIVGFQKAETVAHPLAHLVYAHVAALIGDLRGHDKYLVGGLVIAQPGGKGVHQLLRDAAHAEAFHDDAVVQVEDLRDERRGHAGRQLEQEHPAVQRAAELHRAGGPRRGDVPH